jgi:phosphotriesterase-related protein
VTTIQTVNGPIDSSALGRTYVHEHIFVLTSDVQQNYPDEWGNEDDRVRDAVEKLSALAASGVQTIVDLTVVGLGRYIPRVQQVAAQVPALNIIVATGCYTYKDVPFFFHHRGPALNEALGMEVPDPMVDFFVGDIETGIAGSGVRAGLLMRAVAKAHLATGTPITVHTHPGTQQGFEVLRVMNEESVDPGQVVLAHSGDSSDTNHLAGLADAGFWLGMDRFGLNLEVPFEVRCDTVVEMCRRGYAERMMLSHDAACYIDWVDPNVMAFMPDWNYLHIGNDVLPYLREHGVSETEISLMLVDNPRRYFEGT